MKHGLLSLLCVATLAACGGGGGTSSGSSGTTGGNNSGTTVDAAGPKLGMNLDWATDWSSTEYFNNLMLQSRSLTKIGVVDANGQPVAADLDANGWPTEDFAVYVYVRGIREPVDTAFDLYFKCKGSAPTITASLKEAPTQDAATGIWHAKLYAKRGSNMLGFSIKNTEGGATDIRLYREGADQNKTFNPKFIDFIKGYDTYRFMELLHTNNSTVTRWSERTKPNEPAQDRKGLAWEYVIEFANETRSNIWINIPHQADDDYILNLAKLLKAGLKYNQAVYLEYSNEVWNGGMFVQGGWNTARAIEEIQAGIQAGTPSELDCFMTASGTCKSQYWTSDQVVNGVTVTAADHNKPYISYWTRFRVARQSRHIAKLFASVFGDAALNQQVRVLLPGWGAVYDYNKSQLDWLTYTYPDEPLKNYLYGFATGAYIGDAGYKDANGTSISANTQHSRDELFPWLLGAVEKVDSTKNFALFKALADQHGIKNVIYEGGVDLQHSARLGVFTKQIANGWNPLRAGVDLPLTPDANGNLPTTSATDLSLMREDPRVGEVITALLNKWFKDTDNSLFVWYKPAVKDSTWVYSDSMENFDTIAQKALRAFAHWAPTLGTASTPAKTLFDFNGDGKADILWRYTKDSGDLRLFRMDGVEILGNLPVQAVSDQNWQVAATADFDGDGKTDILWHNNSTGENSLWRMSEAKISTTLTPTTVATGWTLEGAGDTDGDGKADLVWRNAAGETRLFRMDSATVLSDSALSNHASSLKLMAIRDLNADGKADLIWYNASGNEVTLELMNGSSVQSSQTLAAPAVTTAIPAPWVLEAAGDFNGDGKADLLWRNSNTDGSKGGGRLLVWRMNGTTVLSSEEVINNTRVDGRQWAQQIPYADTRLLMAADFDGDGKTDLLWYTTRAATSTTTAGNALKIHLMNGPIIEDWHNQGMGYGGYVDPAWQMVAH